VLSQADELYIKGETLAALRLFDLERANIESGQKWSEKNLEINSSAISLCHKYPDAGVYVLDLRLIPREKIYWLNSALIAARKLKDKQGEGNHLGNLGNAYSHLGEPRKAIEYTIAALAIFEQIESPNAEQARKQLAKWQRDEPENETGK
jgi:tetratricopeptide (TPR) repeat protein